MSHTSRVKNGDGEIDTCGKHVSLPYGNFQSATEKRKTFHAHQPSKSLFIAIFLNSATLFESSSTSSDYSFSCRVMQSPQQRKQQRPPKPKNQQSGAQKPRRRSKKPVQRTNQQQRASNRRNNNQLQRLPSMAQLQRRITDISNVSTETVRAIALQHLIPGSSVPVKLPRLNQAFPTVTTTAVMSFPMDASSKVNQIDTAHFEPSDQSTLLFSRDPYRTLIYEAVNHDLAKKCVYQWYGPGDSPTFSMKMRSQSVANATTPAGSVSTASYAPLLYAAPYNGPSMTYTGVTIPACGFPAHGNYLFGNTIETNGPIRWMPISVHSGTGASPAHVLVSYGVQPTGSPNASLTIRLFKYEPESATPKLVATAATITLGNTTATLGGVIFELGGFATDATNPTVNPGETTGWYGVQVLTTALNTSSNVPIAWQLDYSIFTSEWGNIWAHVPLPSIVDNLWSTSDVNITGAAITLSATSPVLVRGGSVNAAQLAVDRDAFLEVAGLDIIQDVFASPFSNAAIGAPVSFANGFYGFLKPRESTIELKDTIKLSPAGKITHMLNSNQLYDHMIIRVKLPQSTVAGIGVDFQVTTNFAFQYSTLNMWIPRDARPAGTTEEWMAAMRLIQDTLQFHENPLHIRELLTSLRSGLRRAVHFAHPLFEPLMGIVPQEYRAPVAGVQWLLEQL